MQKALISLIFILLFSVLSAAQNQGCVPSVPEGVHFFSSSTGEYSFPVQTGQDCEWQASLVPVGGGTNSFITLITASGRGNGTVRFRLEENKGPERTIGIGISSGSFQAGYNVIQATGCPGSFPITPARMSFPKEGGTGSFFVDVGDRQGCGWFAEVEDIASGVKITSSPGPFLSGNVVFTVPANTGPARTIRIKAANNVFTINQENGCAPAVTNILIPIVPPSGGTVNFSISASPGCSWSASIIDGSWLSIINGNGTGSGIARIQLPLNTGWARVGHVQIAGKLIEITQTEGCVYNLLPSSIKIPSTGGSFSLDLVDSDSSCRNFTPVSTGDFLSNLKFEQVGSTSITFTAAPNGSEVRTATITFGGVRPEFFKTLTITQNDKCADDNKVLNAVRLCRGKKQIGRSSP